MLSLQKMWVQSLVGELRSHKSQGVALIKNSVPELKVAE